MCSEYPSHAYNSRSLVLTAVPLFRPAASDSIFVSIIVKAPVIQILSMLVGFVYLMLDYPAPFLKNTAIHRSFPIRIVVLLLQTFFAILYYQVSLALLLSRASAYLSIMGATGNERGAILLHSCVLLHTSANAWGDYAGSEGQ